MSPTTQTFRYQPERREASQPARPTRRAGGSVRNEWMNPRAAWILGLSITIRDDCSCPDDCPRDHENE